MALSSCIKTGSVQNNDECIAGVNAQAVTYSNSIQPLFAAQCTSCHGSTVSNGASQSLVTLAQVTSQLSTITDYINRPLSDSRHMPPGFVLDGCDKFRIEKWESDGLLP